MIIIYHSRYLDHVLEPGHPESPTRLETIISQLKDENLFLDVIEPKIGANINDIISVHDKVYVEAIINRKFIDPEAPIHKDTYDIASLAVSGAILAGVYAYENNTQSFALIRPPGHHAGVSYGGGFCYFNNVAIAVENLHKRTVIVDIDLHHGNGTSDIFYERDNVMYISTHQMGIYPFTGGIHDIGKGNGEGYTINLPFLIGSGDKTYEYAFSKVIESVIRAYKPSMIFVSLGTDAHYMDTFGSLTLSSQGYVSLCIRLIELAKEICNGRISFILEGGYYLPALSEIVTGIIGYTNGKKIEYQFTEITDTICIGKKTVDDVHRIVKEYHSI